MKFTEGYWEKNERANALYAVQAGYAEKIAAGMRVIATFKPILGRADELDNGIYCSRKRSDSGDVHTFSRV